MARIRYLKPDFFKDEDLARLPIETRLFFAGMWGLADKAGRLEDRPLRLKVEIYPYDEVNVDECLKQLSKPKSGSGKPFIVRYQVDGQGYIQIINWFKHQKPHKTEKESTIPHPNGEWGMGNGETRTLNKKSDFTSSMFVKEPLDNGYITVKEPLKCKESNLHVFNHWNKYTGGKVTKDSKHITWRSHRLRNDSSISPDVSNAISQTLKGGHTAEQICSAIDSYAKVLLGEDYIWSYAWNLVDFLTRGEEKHKQAARKWWRFLPDNFIEDHYLTDAARKKRANTAHGPTAYQLAKEEISTKKKTNSKNEAKTKTG